MTTPSQRLHELGLSLPQVAAPVASYQPSKRVGSLLYTSGQLPFLDGQLLAKGLVGGAGDRAVSPEQAQACARQCALNALAAIDAAVGIDNVASVVKVVVFVASDAAFVGQPLVANGASDLMTEVFGDTGQHARSAVGVATLPLDSPVEVELIVEVN